MHNIVKHSNILQALKFPWVAWCNGGGNFFFKWLNGKIMEKVIGHYAKIKYFGLYNMHLLFYIKQEKKFSLHRLLCLLYLELEKIFIATKCFIFCVKNVRKYT